MKIGEIWELFRDSTSFLPSLVRITEMGVKVTLITEDKNIIIDLICFESLDGEDKNEEKVMKITALPVDVFVKTYSKVYDYETEN